MLEHLAKKDSIWREVAFRFTSDRDEADELVQKMYMRMLEYKIKPENINDNFIKVTMYNLFKDSKKKPKYKQEYCNTFSESFADNDSEDSDFTYFNHLITDEPVDECHKENYYRNRLKILSAKEKEIMTLSYDFSLRQVGEMLNINYATVNRKIEEIKVKILRDKYSKDYGRR
tara:strand:+ start:59 stop:577 length:519 start_codon:yes stop_codon:yes gene_type:complete